MTLSPANLVSISLDCTRDKRCKFQLYIFYMRWTEDTTGQNGET